jgi:hypothetical protein
MSPRPALRREGHYLRKETWVRLARDLDVSLERLVIHEIRGEQRVQVRPTWLETPINDDWMSATRLAVQDGQVVVAELRIFPSEPAFTRRAPGVWSAELLDDAAPVPRGGLSAETVRKVRLTDYRRYTKKILDDLRNKYSSANAREVIDRLLGPVAAAQPLARPRRARGGGRPDTFYAKLADEYARATERGSRQPVADLAKRHNTKKPRMRDMIREARERGLLTFFAQGRPGGTLTQRGRELLKPPTPKARRPHR